MNVIKKNRTRLSFLLILCMFQNIDARSLKAITKDDCEEKNVSLKSEHSYKYKYFFFRQTNHKKVKRIDKVVDENGKEIIKITMKSTESGDEYNFRKFHRLVIIGKEIQEVIYVIGQENGKVITYNFCGEKINTLNMKADDLLEKYRF
jgi:hypothetical protein